MENLATIPAFNPAETYALGANGAVHRGSDGAAIPPDPANADYRAYLAWVASGKVATPAPAPAFDSGAAAAECQRRIYAVASANCQMNMTAFVASGQASDADKAAFVNALGWVQAMRAACASIQTALDGDFAENAKWPTCPAEAIALAARF